MAAKKPNVPVTDNNHPSKELETMLNAEALKSNTSTADHGATPPSVKEKVTVAGVTYEVTEHRACTGKDIEPGTYPTIRLPDGAVRVVINSELRSLAPRGQNVVRAHRQPSTSSQEHKEGSALPEGVVVLSSKALSILRAIQMVSGAESVEEVIEASLPALAVTHDEDPIEVEPVSRTSVTTPSGSRALPPNRSMNLFGEGQARSSASELPRSAMEKMEP